MKEKNIRDEFLDDVIQCVKFQWDRHKIREELANHIEDRRDYYTSKGMTEDEAELNAVSTMGDAKEIGEALNKVHKPWIGRLWIATTVLLVCVVMFTLFNIGDVIKDLKEVSYSTQARVDDEIERIMEYNDEGTFERYKLDEKQSINGVDIVFTDMIICRIDTTIPMAIIDDVVYIFGYIDNGSFMHPMGKEYDGEVFFDDVSVKNDSKNNVSILTVNDPKNRDKTPRELQTTSSFASVWPSSTVQLSTLNQRCAFAVEANILHGAQRLKFVFDKYGEYFEFSIPLKQMRGGSGND